jgi:surface adhesion protein
VAENVKPTFTVHINQPLDHDLVVTLSNNAQVTIKAGDTSAPYEHAAQGDDVYNDAADQPGHQVGCGRRRSHLREPATGRRAVQVTDTTDEVIAKLTATPSVTEGGEITYTITLTNKDGLPINNHSALTFTLSDGKTVITVPANGTVGTHRHRPGQRLRRYQRPDRQIDRYGCGADVGKFEQLTLDKTPVSTTVTDEPGTRANEGDLVKVTITADQTSVAENVKPTFTVHINQPLDHDLVVTLSNNARSPSRPATPARRTSTLRKAMTSTTTLARSAWASSRLWTSMVAPSRTCSWAARRRSCHRHHRRSRRQADRHAFGHRRRRDHLHHHADQQRRPADQQPLALTFTLSDGKTVITVPANGTVGTHRHRAGQRLRRHQRLDRQIDRLGQRRRCRQVRATDPGQDPGQHHRHRRARYARAPTKATWSRSPSPPTRPRSPRTSNRPSPCTSTSRWITTWS